MKNLVVAVALTGLFACTGAGTTNVASSGAALVAAGGSGEFSPVAGNPDPQPDRPHRAQPRPLDPVAGNPDPQPDIPWRLLEWRRINNAP